MLLSKILLRPCGIIWPLRIRQQLNGLSTTKIDRFKISKIQKIQKIIFFEKLSLRHPSIFLRSVKTVWLSTSIAKIYMRLEAIWDLEVFKKYEISKKNDRFFQKMTFRSSERRIELHWVRFNVWNQILWVLAGLQFLQNNKILIGSPEITF